MRPTVERNSAVQSWIAGALSANTIAIDAEVETKVEQMRSPWHLHQSLYPRARGRDFALGFSPLSARQFRPSASSAVFDFSAFASLIFSCVL